MAPKGPHHVEAGWELRVPDPTETLGSCPLPAPPPAPAAAASSGSQPARAGKAVQAAASPARKAPTPAPSGSHAAGSSDSGLASIRQCESGGDYGAVSSSGKYRGAYQFDQQTWESVGGSGDPAAALPAEQDQRAAALKQQRGSSPWPNCG
ncbi:transglycosylase family protein [Candidatus Parcubacteria bacterium]|nr:transglycosylase family protein [Candidatus Parcubacteria bacterium]